MNRACNFSCESTSITYGVTATAMTSIPTSSIPGEGAIVVPGG